MSSMATLTHSLPCNCCMRWPWNANVHIDSVCVSVCSCCVWIVVPEQMNAKHAVVTIFMLRYHRGQGHDVSRLVCTTHRCFPGCWLDLRANIDRIHRQQGIQFQANLHYYYYYYYQFAEYELRILDGRKRRDGLGPESICLLVWVPCGLHSDIKHIPCLHVLFSNIALSPEYSSTLEC